MQLTDSPELDHDEAQKWFLKARALLGEFSEKPLEAAYLLIAVPSGPCGAPNCRDDHWKSTVLCCGRDDILIRELGTLAGQMLQERLLHGLQQSGNA